MIHFRTDHAEGIVDSLEEMVRLVIARFSPIEHPDAQRDLNDCKQHLVEMLDGTATENSEGEMAMRLAEAERLAQMRHDTIDFLCRFLDPVKKEAHPFVLTCDGRIIDSKKGGDEG